MCGALPLDRLPEGWRETEFEKWSRLTPQSPQTIIVYFDPLRTSSTLGNGYPGLGGQKQMWR